MEQEQHIPHVKTISTKKENQHATVIEKQTQSSVHDSSPNTPLSQE